MISMDQLLLDVFLDTRVDALTPAIIAFTLITGPTLMWIYSLVLGLVMRSAFPPIAVGIANLFSHFSKKILERPRPDPMNHLVEETNYSLPSGHAVGAAAFAMVLTLLVKRWWVGLVWIFAILVGLSRLYVGVHWPSDLLAGWVLGALAVFVIYRVFLKIGPQIETHRQLAST